MPRVMPSSSLHAPLLGWYAAHARDLPWRRPERTPWGVLVSEVMLQQTPVDRVVPTWEAWLQRWPTPADLAADPPGDAVRMWGRLGYPRRAVRLHAAASACVERFGGVVPSAHDDLRSLPGVGEYTAAAVRAFAFGRRSVVLDTNVRRVLARVAVGAEHPRPSLSAAERELAATLVPDDDPTAVRWSIAVMELGALVCTAASPRCEACPVRAQCCWIAAGRPAYDGPARRVQRFAGTDRQVRGLLLAVLRARPGPVPKAALDAVWHDDVQRERALDGLVADGLVEPMTRRRYALPGSASPPSGSRTVTAPPR
jgi:A/G-specific adenine glycosylase